MAGFKKFLLRGNVVDLAVAVIIGVAFTAVVTAFTSDILTPIIGAIGGKPDFSSLTFTIHKSQFRYGDFINAIIAFVMPALPVVDPEGCNRVRLLYPRRDAGGGLTHWFSPGRSEVGGPLQASRRHCDPRRPPPGRRPSPPRAHPRFCQASSARSCRPVCPKVKSKSGNNWGRLPPLVTVGVAASVTL
jgi:hypothetical protein